MPEFYLMHSCVYVCESMHARHVARQFVYVFTCMIRTDYVMALLFL